MNTGGVPLVMVSDDRLDLYLAARARRSPYGCGVTAALQHRVTPINDLRAGFVDQALVPLGRDIRI